MADHVTWEVQGCPDDAPDGRCWDCRADRHEPHRPGCPSGVSFDYHMAALLGDGDPIWWLEDDDG